MCKPSFVEIYIVPSLIPLAWSAYPVYLKKYIFKILRIHRMSSTYCRIIEVRIFLYLSGHVTLKKKLKGF